MIAEFKLKLKFWLVYDFLKSNVEYFLFFSTNLSQNYERNINIKHQNKNINSIKGRFILVDQLRNVQL